MDQEQLEVIQAHPLSTHLDAVRVSLSKVARTPADLDSLSSEGKYRSQLFPELS